MRHQEDNEQKALFQWARIYNIPSPPCLDHPKLADYLFAIPNGGKRNIREAARLKAQGVKAGVYDAFLPIPKQGFHGLWIELKVGKNKPTDKQQEWHELMEKCGYSAKICWGWLEAKAVILDYLGAAE